MKVKLIMSRIRNLQGLAAPLRVRTYSAVTHAQPSATAIVKAMLTTRLPAPDAIPANATRYHASNAGTAHRGWALEDSRTAHECCPLASQQTVLASTQQGSVAAYEVKVPSC